MLKMMMMMMMMMMMVVMTSVGVSERLSLSYLSTKKGPLSTKVNDDDDDDDDEGFV